MLARLHPAPDAEQTRWQGREDDRQQQFRIRDGSQTFRVHLIRREWGGFDDDSIISTCLVRTNRLPVVPGDDRWPFAGQLPGYCPACILSLKWIDERGDSPGL